MTRALMLASLILAAGACNTESKDSKPARSRPAGAITIAIEVTKDGFVPEHVTVPAGKPVTLVFERKTKETCATEIVLEVDGKKIERALPLDQPVEIAVTFPKAGELTYACGMDMVHGTISVQ